MWSIKLFELTRFLHPTLLKVLAEKSIVFGSGTINSLYRLDTKAHGESQVHETLPLRAVDEDMKYHPLGMAISEFINNRWMYDPSRPEIKVALFGGPKHKRHIHWQVHPNTIRRKDVKE